MSQIPVHNNTKMPIYVGASMVPPGETRHFPEHQVPAHLRPALAKKAAPAAAPAVTDILDKTIKEIVPLLSTYSDEDLQILKAAEQAGKTRDGIMKAIAEEELRRADARVENPGGEKNDPPAGDPAVPPGGEKPDPPAGDPAVPPGGESGTSKESPDA